MASISKSKNIKKTKSRAGSRAGERRSSGKKPSGTNLDRGGGSAAKKHKPTGTAARGKGAQHVAVVKPNLPKAAACHQSVATLIAAARTNTPATQFLRLTRRKHQTRSRGGTRPAGGESSTRHPAPFVGKRTHEKNRTVRGRGYSFEVPARG